MHPDSRLICQILSNPPDITLLNESRKYCGHDQQRKILHQTRHQGSFQRLLDAPNYQIFCHGDGNQISSPEIAVLHRLTSCFESMLETVYWGHEIDEKLVMFVSTFDMLAVNFSKMNKIINVDELLPKCLEMYLKKLETMEVIIFFLMLLNYHLKSSCM